MNVQEDNDERRAEQSRGRIRCARGAERHEWRNEKREGEERRRRRHASSSDLSHVAKTISKIDDDESVVHASS